MQKSKYFFSLLFCLVFSYQYFQAQSYFTITGNTYTERCESLINCMVNDIQPYSGNVTVKYTSAYYWARIYKGVDSEQAIEKLQTLYTNILNGTTSVTGSDIEFYAHMTIHGYFLCKDKLPAVLRGQIKQFLKSIDFNTNGSTSTLNLDLQRYVTGLLAAQEWLDFTDKNNKNSIQITDFNRPRILKTLDFIYHNNCKEMDAFVYLPTDMMCIRLLAEFSTDDEIRQKAYVVYQQIIAAMVGAWNQGLYVANPPRAKGIDQLVAGPLATNSRITMMAWLFFGNPDNSLRVANQYLSDSGNGAIFCFWMAYQRNIFPMQEILDAEKRKTFPYEYVSYIDDKVVNINNNTTQNWKYYKYTYQSQNYGLATQTEIPYSLTNALSRYTYKETKRTYLAWKHPSAVACMFTVCQDNPERPTDAVNANGIAYGENPFHRVLQHKGAAIGITNVPTTYLNDNRYQLYVPFSNLGIDLKVVSDNWVFCHTGSMMFAFRTIEPFTVMTRSPYNVPNSDVLMFTDMNTHKGSWILQTTEITADLQAATKAEELEKFKTKLLANTSFETLNYDGDRPQLKYTSLDGDVLDLTFFPPTEAYNNQYKINEVVQSLTGSNLYNSPYTKQADKSDDVYIYNTTGEPTILNWNDPVPNPPSGINETHKDGKSISCVKNGGSLTIFNIPFESKVNVCFYDTVGKLVSEKQAEIINGQCVLNVQQLTSPLYIIKLKNETDSCSVKWLNK